MSSRLLNPHEPPSKKRVTGVLLSLLLALALVTALSLSVGSVPIPLANVFGSLFGMSGIPEADRTIIVEIRLPRVLLALTVGAGLSVAGVVFQALLRNPLAEPYILGISSGGTVGAVLVLAFSIGITGITAPLASFAGSASVMFLVYRLAHRHGQLDTYALLLAGVMVGAFFNAIVLVVFSVLHQELRSAFLWLMGNLSAADMGSVAGISPLVLLVSAILVTQAKSFNLISTGDESAMQLGVDVRRVRRVSYFLASLVTGLAVSVSGVIGFVGLVIPHVCRTLLGPDHRILLPASFLVGAGFLVVADTIARTLIAPTEIPVGAITAAVGAPVFVYLLKRQ